MELDLEARLYELLRKHRYESSVTGKSRGFMKHHIASLIKDLLPFVQEEVAREVKHVLLLRKKV